MCNNPIDYSKRSINRKVNKNLISLFEENFNQFNYPIKCKVKDKRSFTNQPVTKWPLKSIQGHPFFYAYLNEADNQVEIYDDSALLLLNYQGNYGNCHFLDNLISNRFHKMINRKRNDTPTQPSFTNHLSNPSNLFELNQDTYRHNLHIDSLNESFKEFGELDYNELLNKKHSKNCDSRSSLDNKKTEENKEDHSIESENMKSNNEHPDDTIFEDLKSLECMQDYSKNMKKKNLNSFEGTFIEIKKSFNQNFIDREEYILRLDLEEAFFLKHVFGNLSVQMLNRSNSQDDKNSIETETTEMQVDENRKTDNLFSNLNLINLWLKCIRLCNSSNQCFITKYAAYFYFKSKGFIVKNGIKFGSDFVLYNRNPSFVHSTYSIMLIKKTSESYDQLLKLINIQAFVRMTKCVVKVPVLCIVKFPINLTQDELQTPDVIRKLQIKCLLMERWISSVERDQH